MDEKKEFSHRMPIGTKLFDLLNGYTYPVKRINPSAAEIAQVQAAEVKRKKAFRPYEFYTNKFFKDNDGVLWKISDNRNDDCYHDVRDYLALNVSSSLVNKYFVDLVVMMNQIDSSRIYVLTGLFKANEDKSSSTLMIEQSFAQVYNAVTELKRLLEDDKFDVTREKRLSLLAAVVKIQAGFKAIEEEAIAGMSLPEIERKLQNLELSPLEEIREYISGKLGDRTIGDLEREGRITLRPKARSDANMNEYEHIQNRLTRILKLAQTKMTAENTEIDSYGVSTVFLTLEDAKIPGDVDVLMEGRDLAGDKGDVNKKNKRPRVEVRIFSKGAYQRTKTEDFIEKVNFFADVASEINPAAKIQIEAIRKKYQDLFKSKELKLEAKQGSVVPKDYEKVLKKAADKLWEYQAELVGAAYPGDSRKAAQKIKDLKAAGQQYLIDNGRPIIVHVFPPDEKNKNRIKISAQFPKGKTTYPSDYRHSEEEGVNPNSALDVTAEYSNGTVHVKSVGSRAVSYSVLHVEDEAKRKALNVANAKQDIIDRLILEKRSLVPGQVIEISSISLLTPLNKAGDLAGKIKGGYEPETRQVLEHNQALMDELDGEEITVNGITVKLSTLHINISVKEPGSIEAPTFLVNDKVLKEINEKGFKKYKDKQTAALEKRENVLQRKYFFEVDHEYENEEYKTSEDKAFLFAAKFVRSEELRGALVCWSCKSTRDRSEHLAGYRTALVDLENDGLETKTTAGRKRFDKSLLENQDYGAGKRANAMSVSGFGANRVNDPSKQRKKDKLDSMTSSLSKAKYSEKKALEILATSTEKDRDVLTELDECLAQLPDGNFKNLVTHLREIKNPYLRAAMVDALRQKGKDAVERIDALKFKEAVEKINNLFPDTFFTQREFKKKSKEFLEIVSGAFGLDDMQSVFLTALMTHQSSNQKELIKELKSNPEQIPEYLKQLDTAILLVKKFNRWEALKLSLLRKRLEKIAPELRFGKPGVDEKPERVWVFEGKSFGKSLTPEEAPSEDVADKHVLYESKNQLKYKPPMDSEPDLEVIKKVIEFAMKKFKVDNIDDLEFDGSKILVAQVEKIKAEQKKSARNPAEETAKDTLELSRDRSLKGMDVESMGAPTAAAH